MTNKLPNKLIHDRRAHVSITNCLSKLISVILYLVVVNISHKTFSSKDKDLKKTLFT